MDRFIKILAHLSKGKRLSQIQSKDAFLMIMNGAITQAKVSAFLMALKKGDETAEEIVGAVKVLRKLGLKIKAPANAIDTCGTGGDGLGTLNISTAAAIITASCGIPVSKHGNRSITSKSGSA
ncbi:MAG: anthranilate phosphoribosyltransferase, partial [Pseudomonadota bacterium]|nr:anthranilate phosphoribosyltransferase [Pseudomonadota bacterium]